MEPFADVVVAVPEKSATAVVERREPTAVRRPPEWLQLWRGLVLGLPTAVMVGAVDHVGPLGPVSAAVWLGLNWWLY